eukprot:g6154.t1
MSEGRMLLTTARWGGGRLFERYQKKKVPWLRLLQHSDGELSESAEASGSPSSLPVYELDEPPVAEAEEAELSELSEDAGYPIWAHKRFEGGIYTASSIAGSTRFWNLRFNDPEEILADTLYWMSDCTPHESVALDSAAHRQYFRLVTSSVSAWYPQHSTENPLGIKVDPKITRIVPGDKFEELHRMQGTPCEKESVAMESLTIQFLQALEMLEQMTSEVLQPNEICFSAVIALCDAWEAALKLLALAREAAVQASEAGYGAAIRSCEASGQWACALQLLQSMSSERLDATNSAAAAMAVCSSAGRWEEVLLLADSDLFHSLSAVDRSTVMGTALMECERHSAAWAERGVLRRLAMDLAPGARGAVRCSAWLRRFAAATVKGGLRNAALLREIADSEPSVRPYHQAAAMLKHILCKVAPLDVDGILIALDEFGQEDALHSEVTLRKRLDRCLLSSGGGLPAGGHHGVFEIGTYWGTSSLRLAHALRAGTGTSSPRGFGATVTTVELDPVHVAVARVLFAFAGVDVQVLTGHSRAVLPRLGARRFAAVLMDRWGSEYAAGAR